KRCYVTLTPNRAGQSAISGSECQAPGRHPAASTAARQSGKLRACEVAASPLGASFRFWPSRCNTELRKRPAEQQRRPRHLVRGAPLGLEALELEQASAGMIL